MQRTLWERKIKKKKLEKKSIRSKGYISFSKGFPSWCHGAERVRKYLMFFYPLCLCTLCIRQSVTIKLILPAFCISLEGKGYLLLSAAKEMLEIRWKQLDSMQGWCGGADWEMGHAWWIAVRPLSKRRKTKSALLALFYTGILKSFKTSDLRDDRCFSNAK